MTIIGEQTPGYKPETISNARIAAPLRDTPQTINVVPRKVIEDQNATTLRDVLLNVPGISYQAGEGGVPAGDQLAIRGFSARTDMFVDGVRDIGGYTRDTFNVEQAEVFKGPNSAYSGRGSTGGSINLVTKTPKLNPFYNADLSYGTYDYYRATIDLNQPIQELEKLGVSGAALRFNGMFHDQDFSGRDYVHDTRWALNPTFAIGLGTATRASVSYLHMEQDNLPSYGIPFVNNSNNPYRGASAVGKVAPVPYHKFFGLVDRDFEEININVGRLKIEHDINEDHQLRNQTQYGRTYRDSLISAPRVVRNPADDPIFGPNTPAAVNAAVGSDGAYYGLNYQAQSRDQADNIFANRTDLESKFNTGPLEHTLISGLEYSHEKQVNYLRSFFSPGALPAQTSNPLDPDPFSPFHRVDRNGARNEAIIDALGVSAFDTVKINDKFLVTAGLRGDLFDARYNQYTNNTVTRFSREDTAVTWRGGLVYKPLPNGSVYAGYGTSFNPSAEGFTLTGALQAVEPERANSYEIGSKWDFFNDRLAVEGAVFRTDKTNYRNTDPVTGEVSASGELRVQGVELQVQGKITDKWSVIAGYAFMHSEILESRTETTYNGVAIPEQGHKLSNTPEQTASLFTTYELPYKIMVGTGLFFVDERFSNNIETQWVPGYVLHNAMIGWSPDERFSFRVNVSNLWDEEYIDRVGGGHAIPGAGRTVIFTAMLRF